MKTNLVLKNIEIAGIKIGEVAVEQEYSVSEILKLANGSKSFVKELLKDLPEMLADFKKTIDYTESVEKKKNELKVKFFDEYVSAINNATSISEVDSIVDEASINIDLSLKEMLSVASASRKRKEQLQ